jgi:hypothetical protein
MRRSNLTPELRWNEQAGRYIRSTGHFVARSEVRAALDRTLDTAEKRMAAVTEQLRQGSIALPDWQLQMAREVKSVHLASAALAKGGWAQMAPADYGRAGQLIRRQYAFLRNFAQQVANGEQRLDGTLARRAGMYVAAGRGTFHQVERREMEQRGMTEERNLRHAGDSCQGCLTETARGWVGIGELVPVGSRTCRTACRCSVEFR